MKDTTKLPRLDFAAGLWQHRNRFECTLPKRKFSSVIDLSPRLELSVVGEAEDEIPDRTKNLEPGAAH
jgi:hypothetical protein